MPETNPIILDELKSYFQGNSDIPSEMQGLVEKLLKVEELEHGTNEGIDKVYDQILDQFISNKPLVEWSEKYVG